MRPARAMRAPSGLLLLPPLPTDPANHGTDPDPRSKVRTEQPPRHAGKEPHQGAQSGEGSPSPEGDAQYLQFISPSATWRYSLGRAFIRRARRSVFISFTRRRTIAKMNPDPQAPARSSTGACGGPIPAHPFGFRNITHPRAPSTTRATGGDSSAIAATPTTTLVTYKKETNSFTVAPPFLRQGRRACPSALLSQDDPRT